MTYFETAEFVGHGGSGIYFRLPGRMEGLKLLVSVDSNCIGDFGYQLNKTDFNDFGEANQPFSSLFREASRHFEGDESIHVVCSQSVEEEYEIQQKGAYLCSSFGKVNRILGIESFGFSQVGALKRIKEGNIFEFEEISVKILTLQDRNGTLEDLRLSKNLGGKGLGVKLGTVEIFRLLMLYFGMNLDLGNEMGFYHADLTTRNILYDFVDGHYTFYYSDFGRITSTLNFTKTNEAVITNAYHTMKAIESDLLATKINSYHLFKEIFNALSNHMEQWYDLDQCGGDKMMCCVFPKVHGFLSECVDIILSIVKKEEYSKEMKDILDVMRECDVYYDSLLKYRFERLELDADESRKDREEIWKKLKDLEEKCK